ncbi:MULTISPECIES: ArnT family glycosyltransferase [Streptomycetaceae]|uniref:Putative mannosyltransferase n=1 Tax=Streptantibioticus cattleyicolor (strain ATCC 35852 / DSM 46488 / JCM 4925 / NBRC 14057 / NRRL 8057) TaxID=1003195 RepID=F8JYB5_STREN|nr:MULTISPECIES: glycosyltransferase family 39 protein [Streptomycetaceae]AEW95909.1 putative mannosyltransferase [Streptantibioticus cattleyicolor NRRL 8057 = DSM 46488]MYS60446.1 mannosyltransferase [Streptomyces sp. SID5468]CCB76245.1 Putative mannosyltransferase (modular protein) [Streptantibioticus cattleyicolor NRRL 8057 = DSM 46488]
MATTVPVPASGPAARRAPWRSRPGDPGYARPALLVILALAALLYAWGINHSEYHTFYANAARSMTENWKAFFFGSFDPGNSITLDKLPGFLWPQAISARILGFHPWTLVLPQVLEGVASVAVLHRVVRRWAGVNAALIASAAFLLTPVAVGLFRTAVEDPMFTLCVLLAADATQRAARTGRLRPLLLAGFWVGLGFQAKMLEAWAVLPALAAVHLLSAPTALRRRLAHLGLAAVVTTAVSLSWMIAVTLTPAQDRPYVDGTTDNSAFSMVIGYNFLNRFSSLGISAASTGSVSATQGGGHGGGHGQGGPQGSGQEPSGQRAFDAGTFRHGARDSGHDAGARDRGTSLGVHAGAHALNGAAQRAPQGGGWGGEGQDGWSKMFGSALASQTGWLYPFAAIAVVCGLLWRRGSPRTDRARAGFVLWGVWLATYFLVFSAGSVGGHTYYMGVVAVPLAALTGGGVTLLWRAYRAGGPRTWALPAAVAATTAWAVSLAARFPSFLPWLAPVVGVAGVLAVVLLVVARPGGRVTARSRTALAGLLAAFCALLLAPGAWAVQVLTPGYHGSGMGAVGPSGGGHGGGVVRAAGRGARVPWSDGRHGGGGGFGGFGSGSGRLTAEQRGVLDYATAHRGSARYVLATTSWSAASPYILGAGADVLPVGGFSGRAPFPTADGFRQLVRSGQVRYVLLGGTTRGSGGPAAAITSWVRAACAKVPPASYGAVNATAQSFPSPGAPDVTAQSLYACSPAAR